MKATWAALVLTLAASTLAASAQPVRWTRYNIPESGTSVDFPSSIFTETAGRPEGYGQRFRTADGPHDPGRAQRPERFSRCFSGKEASASTHSVQASDTTVLCGLQLQGRQGLVQPLQLLRAAGPLRADQLSRRRRARLGQDRHSHQPVAQRQIASPQAHADVFAVPRLKARSGRPGLRRTCE
jgi:hypothetical protein